MKMAQGQTLSDVCWDHFGEEHVQVQIKTTGKIKHCDYCGKRKRTLGIDDLASMAHQAFESNFTRADYRLQYAPDSDDTHYELGGDFVDNSVGELFMTEEEIGLAIYNVIVNDYSEGVFEYADEELHIETIEPDGYSYRRIWEDFSLRIKYQNRFFDPEAISDLKKIFGGISDLQSANGDPVIRIIEPNGPDSTLFRARRADSEERRQRVVLLPSTELGPPPPILATAGRLNPDGIAVFYGAFDPSTCVAEVRSMVGGIVAVCQFQLIESVKVLDLTVLDAAFAPISYFDPYRIGIVSQRLFLSDFHSEISKPVLPRSRGIDYLPTQVIAEFLANQFNPRLDGVIYNSTLRSPPRRNVVLFPRSARVEREESKIDVNGSYRGELTDFGYYLEKMAEKEDRSNELSPGVGEPFSKFISYLGEEEENTTTTLRYVQDSLTLHRVMSMQQSTKTISVHLSEQD